jgi:hypothetical protein
MYVTTVKLRSTWYEIHPVNLAWYLSLTAYKITRSRKNLMPCLLSSPTCPLFVTETLGWQPDEAGEARRCGWHEKTSNEMWHMMCAFTNMCTLLFWFALDDTHQHTSQRIWKLKHEVSMVCRTSVGFTNPVVVDILFLLARVHDNVLDAYSWFKHTSVGISIRYFSCMNLRTSGATGMSLDVKNAMRMQIHPDLCALDDVYYICYPIMLGQWFLLAMW